MKDLSAVEVVWTHLFLGILDQKKEDVIELITSTYIIEKISYSFTVMNFIIGL
jgi:hypothetical protein